MSAIEQTCAASCESWPHFKSSGSLNGWRLWIVEVYYFLSGILNYLLKPPLLVPPTQPLNRLLETFRKSDSTIALVADEFGGIAGLITLHDVMETIIGDFDSAGTQRPSAVRREDGSWLVDAMIRIDELEDCFPGLPLESAEEREYSTLSGFILQALGKIPATGDYFTTVGGFRIEVVDLDRNRIDKVLITPPADC
jgi:putative hemolysin